MNLFRKMTQSLMGALGGSSKRAAKKSAQVKRVSAAKKTKRKVSSKKSKKNVKLSTLKKKKSKRPKNSTNKKARKKNNLAAPLGELIGEVTHYFPQVKAAAVKLKGELTVGQALLFKGHTTHFKQTIKSLQINRKAVDKGLDGEEVGIQVKSRVRVGDSVYLQK